jgi:hypothetical protein
MTASSRFTSAIKKNVELGVQYSTILQYRTPQQ